MNTVGHNKNMDTVHSWSIGSYVSSLLSILAGVSFDKYLAFGGFIVLIATFLMNRHYRKKDEIRKASEERRREERHAWEKKRASLELKQIEGNHSK